MKFFGFAPKIKFENIFKQKKLNEWLIAFEKLTYILNNIRREQGIALKLNKMKNSVREESNIMIANQLN